MRMLRSIAGFLALVLLPTAASAVTLDEVVYLSKAGVSESVILTLIDRDRTVFAISPDQLLSLKRDGVSDTVVLAMLKSGRTEGETAAARDEEFNKALYLSDRAAMQMQAQPPPEPTRMPEVVTVPIPVPVPYAVGAVRHHRQRSIQPTFAPAVAPPAPTLTGVTPMTAAQPPAPK